MEDKEITIGKKDVVACNYWKACDYYKQLKRLEQENAELKAENEKLKKCNEELTSDNLNTIQEMDNERRRVEELKAENEMIINEYNKLQVEIIGDMEFKGIMLTGITPLKVLQNLKERNRELQAFYDVHESFKTDFDTNRKLLDKYRTCLQEIKAIVSKIINGYIRPYGDYNQLKQILDLITKAEEE